jgi:hypothetical protein
MSTYHCLTHPEFTSNDADEICPECGSFLVDENNQPANQATAAPIAEAIAGVASNFLVNENNRPATPVVARVKTGNSLTTCPHCGDPMEPEDEFCMSCGKAPRENQVDITASPQVAPITSEVEVHNVSRVSAPEPTYPATLKLVARFTDDERERSKDAVAPKNKAERATNLDKSVVKIGRTDKESNIFPHLALDGDSGVSRRHCQLIRQSDGSYALLDTGSANGTRLNGTIVNPDEAPPVVKAGDIIEMGFWFTITVEAINS